MSPEKRTDDHVKTVCSSLIDSVPEFLEFTPKIQKSIAKRAILQEFETGRVIIRENHKADNYYFIVSGVASVTAFKTDPVTGQDQAYNLAFLRKGKSFGELALMHGLARNATIICHSNVSVLTIERDDFIDIFMPAESGQEPEHISFLRTVDIISAWPLDKLPHHDPRICLLTFFRKGAIMCQNSLTNEWVFVIKQGTCRVIKDIRIAKEKISFLKKPLNVPSNYLGK